MIWTWNIYSNELVFTFYLWSIRCIGWEDRDIRRMSPFIMVGRVIGINIRFIIDLFVFDFGADSYFIFAQWKFLMWFIYWILVFLSKLHFTTVVKSCGGEKRKYWNNLEKNIYLEFSWSILNFNGLAASTKWCGWKERKYLFYY